MSILIRIILSVILSYGVMWAGIYAGYKLVGKDDIYFESNYQEVPTLGGWLKLQRMGVFTLVIINIIMAFGIYAILGNIP